MGPNGVLYREVSLYLEKHIYVEYHFFKEEWEALFKEHPSPGFLNVMHVGWMNWPWASRTHLSRTQGAVPWQLPNPSPQHGRTQ